MVPFLHADVVVVSIRGHGYVHAEVGVALLCIVFGNTLLEAFRCFGTQAKFVLLVGSGNADFHDCLLLKLFLGL